MKTQPVVYGSYNQYLHPTSHFSLLIWSQCLLGTYHMECTGSSPLQMRMEQGRHQPSETQGWVVRRLLTQPEKECPQTEGTDMGVGARTHMLTDDPGKETELHDPARRQGPQGPGKTDPWQVKTLEKHLWHSRWLRQGLQSFPSQIKINMKQSK